MEKTETRAQDIGEMTEPQMTQAEFTDKMETHQAFIHGKSAELLRYHSVKQILDNIERLEYQLRNNNFKPREEQKILDEISMLQKSIRTLREYEAKQTENKKYRAERTRLIEERNNNYSKIRTLYAKEDEIKKEIAVLRGDISASRKSIDQLRQLRPKLEQEWTAQQRKLQAARNKRYEEKKRLRQEQIRERQEEKRKLW
ncbi:hypothetical protein E2C01_009356 [Portunus trituberculatus]|uniref:Uncharacterized protein n=1 Tax=Portunus trituberculatus TaxID=210409 RepID=A0A5B7D4P0_PORTR|nr:hypothetical protein [Portunus trituberculatus]